MSEAYFKAVRDHLAPDIPCLCDNCNQRLPYHRLRAIGDCSLTPGDASPAGRCPHCQSLAYPDRAKDRARDGGPDLLKAARAFINAFGGDVPDWIRCEFASLENACGAAEGLAPAQFAPAAEKSE